MFTPRDSSASEHAVLRVWHAMTVRILIVDDSLVFRKLLRKTLEIQVGWQVCGEAANGREGVEMAGKISPDLIVLDLSMPVMNGIEAARILGQQMPDIPVIMFTSFCSPNMEREMLGAGVTKVISKSGPLADLIESIRSLVKEAA